MPAESGPERSQHIIRYTIYCTSCVGVREIEFNRKTNQITDEYREVPRHEFNPETKRRFTHLYEPPEGEMLLDGKPLERTIDPESFGIVIAGYHNRNCHPEIEVWSMDNEGTTIFLKEGVGETRWDPRELEANSF